MGAHGPWRIQLLPSHSLSVDEGGYEDGGSPDSCLNHTLDTGRQAGSSHWHQDVRVTATATGDVAEALYHLPCHFAGTALEALVGKHGHPQTEE